ncbi:hypothetical protein EJB05_52850, partial [Eragrostis curvula]
MVLLYNYYHRKYFPQLAFADQNEFKLMYLKYGGRNAKASVTVDRAFEDACGIAKALDAEQDSPPTSMWPISKVAVLLVDPTGKKCLIDNGSVTKGVWSILEKDIDLLAPGSSHEVELNSEPYKLQQAAYLEAERKTGMKGASLRLLEAHLVYSLSKKETTAKLFVLQYEKSVNSDLTEMPIEDLISRMRGPIFTNEAFPETTHVVDYYHILPYKEVLLNLLNRERSLDSSQTIPKEQPLHRGRPKKDESLKEQEANSKSNIKNTTTNASDPKKNKGMKEVGNSGTDKNRKDSNLNRKRKAEALEASPKKGNGSLSSPDAETLKLVSNAANPETTIAQSEGLVNMETSGQTDKNKSSGGFDNLQTNAHQDNNKTRKHSVSKNISVDTIKVNASEGDLIVKTHASENQIVKAMEIAGSINVNLNDQMYATLQSLRKMRKDVVPQHCMLEDQISQFDMDTRTILTDGKVTPRVISVIQKYEEYSSNVVKVASSTSSGEGSQTLKMKRLTEAVFSLTKCEARNPLSLSLSRSLSLSDTNSIRMANITHAMLGLYKATVYLVCPDIELNADGGMKTAPREARDSAAAAMLHQLHTKGKEKLAENIAIVTIKVNAPEGDLIVKTHASENQIVKPVEIAGSINVNLNDQMYATLQSLRKMRKDVVPQHCMLEDQISQFDMDTKTILTDGKVTPRVISIIQKYEEFSSNVVKVASSTSSGEGSQTLKMKWLTEAELDEICLRNNWLLPRYTIFPSLIDGLYKATVYLVCPDLELNANGGMKTTPREARDSAAAAMLHQLHMKGKEKLAELDSSTQRTGLNKIPEK